jgi:hypothetical protein
MNRTRDVKLTRVISTKITDEEYNLLQRLAGNYKSRGYIAKATTAEILRLIVRVYSKWVFSHSSDQTGMNQIVTQSNESEGGNSTVTMLGINAANNRDESTNATSQGTSQSSSIPSSDTSLMGNAQHQLSDLLCKILSTYNYYYDDYFYYYY